MRVGKEKERTLRDDKYLCERRRLCASGLQRAAESRGERGHHANAALAHHLRRHKFATVYSYSKSTRSLCKLTSETRDALAIRAFSCRSAASATARGAAMTGSTRSCTPDSTPSCSHAATRTRHKRSPSLQLQSLPSCNIALSGVYYST